MKIQSSPCAARKLLFVKVHGQPSWRIASSEVEAFVTRTGGHLGPVTFDRKNGKFAPLEVAPWAEESDLDGIPQILRVLRGDFFCMPFGGNSTVFRGEHHAIHGETANKEWSSQGALTSDRRTTLHLRIRTKVRSGTVDKYVLLIEGHNAVYQRHVISGMSGPMSFGHHAIVKFPDKAASGLLSVSPFRFGQVFVEPTEKPEDRGYSSLLPGAKFDSLDKVPTLFGTEADLSRYPARRGYEDIVTLVSDPEAPFAWTAVVFPAQQYAWFALKDPRVLRQTLIWISNGGRHYPPWNGRHVNVMGLEEVTSYFHQGLAESVKKNPISDAGYPTSVNLDPRKPLTVNYIMAAAKLPKGFDHVAQIEKNGVSGVTLISRNGKKSHAPLDLTFMSGQEKS